MFWTQNYYHQSATQTVHNIKILQNQPETTE